MHDMLRRLQKSRFRPLMTVLGLVLFVLGMVLFMLNRTFSHMAHMPPWRRCSAASSCCRAALRWSSSRSLLYWK